MPIYVVHISHAHNVFIFGGMPVNFFRLPRSLYVYVCLIRVRCWYCHSIRIHLPHCNENNNDKKRGRPKIGRTREKRIEREREKPHTNTRIAKIHHNYCIWVIEGVCVRVCFRVHAFVIYSFFPVFGDTFFYENRIFFTAWLWTVDVVMFALCVQYITLWIVLNVRYVQCVLYIVHIFRSKHSVLIECHMASQSWLDSFLILSIALLHTPISITLSMSR